MEDDIDFGLSCEPERENRKLKKAMFDGNPMSEAIAYVSNLKNQDTKRFSTIKAEMYAWAMENRNKEMFAFLESRFGTVEIQDKEVHLHFDVAASVEEARA